MQVLLIQGGQIREQGRMERGERQEDSVPMISASIVRGLAIGPRIVLRGEPEEGGQGQGKGEIGIGVLERIEGIAEIETIGHKIEEIEGIEGIEGIKEEMEEIEVIVI